MCAVCDSENDLNRTDCRQLSTTDKFALSVILLFIKGMAQNSEQNTENNVQESSAPSDSTAVAGYVSATEMPAGLPVGRTELVRLKGLGGDLAHDYEIPRA